MKFSRFFQVSTTPILALLFAASCSPAKTKPAKGDAPAAAPAATSGLNAGDEKLKADNQRLAAENGTLKAVSLMVADMNKKTKNQAREKAMAAGDAMAAADLIIDRKALTEALSNKEIYWSNTPAGKRNSDNLTIFSVNSESGEMNYVEGARPVGDETVLVPASLERTSAGVTGINLSYYNGNENEFAKRNTHSTVNAKIGEKGELILQLGEDSEGVTSVYHRLDKSQKDYIVGLAAEIKK